MMKSVYRLIPTDQISFDTENPRIKVALTKYGDSLTEERIRFALKTATEGSSSTSSYRALKDSIRASKGISTPIRVWKTDNQFVCVDGNTRLAIYNELRDEKAAGDWTMIQCLELIGPTPPDDDQLATDVTSVQPVNP